MTSHARPANALRLTRRTRPILAASIAALLLVALPHDAGAGGVGPTTGSVIDNLANTGPGSPTPTGAVFSTDAATTARTGATIDSLTMGHTVTLTPTYAAQAGNGNAAMDSLVLTGGGLTATATASVTAGSATKLQFGSTGTALAAIDVSTGASLTLAANVTSVTSGGLTKTGAGTLVLAGSSQITGAVAISAGTLTASGGAAISDASAVSLVSSATLDVLANETIGSLAGTGGSVVLTGGLVVGDGSSTSFGGLISGASFLQKVGAGTLTLTSANTYNGGTTVTNGTLAVTGAGSLATAFITIDPAGRLTTDSDAIAAATPVDTRGTFTTSGTDSYAAITQSGGTINGTGVQTLSGAFTQLGGTTGGSVDINAATFTQSGGATLAAGTTVTSSGAQTLQGGTIAGTLDGSGAVTISAGTTSLTGAGAILNASVSVADGATLAIRPGVNGAITNIGGGRLTLEASSTLTMVDGAASDLNVGSVTFAGGPNSTLVFEVGGATSAAADRIVPGFFGANIVAPGGKITIAGFGTVANASGSYDLIRGSPNMSLTTNPLSLANTRVGIGGRAYPLTLTTISTTLTLNVGAAAGADQAFWKGDVDGLWFTNNAGNTNWATDASGRTDLGSVPGNLTDVIFSATGAGNLTTMGGGGTVNSITFNSGSGAVSIGGPGIRLLGAGANNLGLNVTGGTASRTVSAGLAPDIDQTWLNDGAFGVTTLTLSGGVFSAGTARQLSLAGRGNTLLSGGLPADSISGLVKTGAGTMTLGNAGNGFTGPVTINAGVVAITADGALGNSANDVTLNAGGALRIGATLTLGSGRSVMVTGNAASPSGLDLSAGITGTLAHPTALTGAGTLQLSTTGGTASSTLSIDEAQGFTGEVVVGAPGKLVGDTFSRRIFAAASGLTLRLQNSGKLASTSGVTVHNGSALAIHYDIFDTTDRLGTAPLTFHTGRFQFNPISNFNIAITDRFGPVNATGLLTLTGSAAAGPTTGTTLNFGALTRTDKATLALQSNGAFGQGSIGGGANAGVNYRFSGQSDSGGTVGTPTRNIEPYAAATLDATRADFAGLVTYDANGFRPLFSSEYNVVSSQAQFDALSGAPQNVDINGVVALTVTGTRSIRSLTAQGGSPTFTGSGTLEITSGAVANFNTVTFNGPTLNFSSTGYFHLGFPVSVQGSSTISGGGGVVTSALGAGTDYQLRLTNTAANTFIGGLFINGNSQVSFTANNQLGQIAGGLNAGAITLGGGQLLLAGASSAILSDGGTARPIFVNASGGTIGTTESFSSLFIPGVISGPGQVQFGGGTQSNANGRVFLTNPAANTYTGGTLISPGILSISNPNQLGTGPILLNGGTLRAGAALNFATPLTVVENSTLDLSTAGQVTLSGGISGSAGATGSAATSLVLTTAGSATLNIDGDSTFAGTLDLRHGRTILRGQLSGITAITTSSTLRLGISDGINDSAALTFNRGALETQGFSETLGTLTLNNAGLSTSIDLGTGASVLRFAASNAQPWTGTLSITNWSGSTLGGGADQLFFGFDPTGLTASQLAAITFSDPAGFAPGAYPAQLLTNGELVALIPEPGTCALLLAGLGVLGFRRRPHRQPVRRDH